MKAIVHHQYGPADLLTFEEVPKPVPADDEVLIRVRAASVNSLDWRIMKAEPFLIRFMGLGVFRPKSKRLGADVAGEIEAVGKSVKDFHPGDELFGDVSGNGLGAFGEYVCAKESAVARKPSQISFEQAAALPVAGVTALQGLRLAGPIRSGQRVLINGASSGVGTFAVQIAKAFGAEVTAVCSGGKADAVRAVGADHIIDTREDFTKGGQRYDLILDIAVFRPIRELARALVDGGSCVVVGGSTPGIFKIILFGWLFGLIYGKGFQVVTARATRPDLERLMQLVESGKVKPYIDRTYPLAETADAIRYLQGRHAKGKVVIVV